LQQLLQIMYCLPDTRTDRQDCQPVSHSLGAIDVHPHEVNLAVMYSPFTKLQLLSLGVRVVYDSYKITSTVAAVGPQDLVQHCAVKYSAAVTVLFQELVSAHVSEQMAQLCYIAQQYKTDMIDNHDNRDQYNPAAKSCERCCKLLMV
jgi:hypothetical protein